MTAQISLADLMARGRAAEQLFAQLRRCPVILAQRARRWRVDRGVMATSTTYGVPHLIRSRSRRPSVPKPRQMSEVRAEQLWNRVIAAARGEASRPDPRADSQSQALWDRVIQTRRPQP